MNFGDVLENGLFALGQVLRLPVMLLLWVCVLMTLYYLGRCLIELIRQRGERAGFELKRWLQGGDVLQAGEERCAQLPAHLRRLLRAAQQLHASKGLANGGLENLLAEHEERVRHELDGPRALVKLGPSLGLIGTLIPMGTSLAAMAAGNLNAMGGQMVVAFTSTIIGLATGTVAFGLVSLRQNGTSVAIREQRYLAEVLAVDMERC
jgi:biopolymer transport protein ExbB/TolQ